MNSMDLKRSLIFALFKVVFKPKEVSFEKYFIM